MAIQTNPQYAAILDTFPEFQFAKLETLFKDHNSLPYVLYKQNRQHEIQPFIQLNKDYLPSSLYRLIGSTRTHDSFDIASLFSAFEAPNFGSLKINSLESKPIRRPHPGAISESGCVVSTTYVGTRPSQCTRCRRDPRYCLENITAICGKIICIVD